ncbi:hypothetical protein LRX75_22620 [Rhizobium sp. DKSPLA3]|uniref:Uncharacterized protein n=1 Tax=Rhizobium quercicola TaxID=2901226 RepID=A0A9X1NV52_9HYPH|nr:hypothetical protein [Rhizobium quercicola]MCD7111825.1 hypothetical protein [Rhizobium quercicola]
MSVVERGQKERGPHKPQRSPIVLTPHRLEEDIQTEPETSRPPVNVLPPRVVGWAVLAGLATAAIVGVFMQSRQDRQPADQVLTDAARAARLATFQSHGPLRLSAVPDAARLEVLAQMGMEPQARQALEQDLVEGRAHLGWLTLWDDQVQDGDVIALTGAGFSRTIALTKQPQQIAVPISGQGDAFVVKGIRDGGAGITVAATTDAGTVPMPIMAPGETFNLILSGA